MWRGRHGRRPRRRRLGPGRTQPLLGGLGFGRVGRQHRRERVQGSDGDRGQQFVAVGEVPVRGGGGDAEPAASLGKREVAHAPFCDQVYCGIDEPCS